MTEINHAFRLAARPDGMPKRTDFDYAEEAVPEPGDGEVLVRNLYISLDPAMRGWMNDARSYIPPIAIGEVIRAGAVAKVVQSRHSRIAEGEYVTGMLGMQEYAVAPGDNLTRLDPDLAPLPTYLGALGMPGLTAYFGLLDIGKPQPGETVVVSAAAGAVGSVVGQIARIKGCRAVGIAGGEEKCRWITEELGFDAAIDYKAGDVPGGLKQHCPQGIDVYFDNVGGDILDDVLVRLHRGARIPLCGAISQYNNTGANQGPKNYMMLLVARALMKGFLVFDYMDRYPDALREMGAWLASGKLVAREEIVEGLDTFPDTLLKLFRGENIGKLVLKVGNA
jgi:NADPH-dependent curcumin reductase CurA